MKLSIKRKAEFSAPLYLLSLVGFELILISN